MGKKYLIDSNVIIDFTSNTLPDKGLKFVKPIFENEFYFSFVSKIEVLGFEIDSEKEKLLRAFFDFGNLIAVTDEIIQQTILLRKKKKIKMADAIIAATAIAENLILLTRNEKDFQNIDNLQLLNPFNL